MTSDNNGVTTEVKTENKNNNNRWGNNNNKPKAKNPVDGGKKFEGKCTSKTGISVRGN